MRLDASITQMIDEGTAEDVPVTEFLANSMLHISAAVDRGLLDGVVYDACRARLMEIGEAVKHIDPDVLSAAPDVAWNQIARMRDVLVHHYHDTDFAVVESVIVERLPSLREAIVRLKSVGDNSR